MIGLGFELARKAGREQRAAVSFCAVMVGVFFVLGSYLFITFGEMNMEAMGKLSPQLIQAMFGGMFGELTPLDTWLITLFVHPLVLTMFAVVVVANTSRSLAGEIDRGTIDLVLSGPVRRWQMVVAPFCVLLLSLAALCTSIWLAMLLGLRIGEIELNRPLGDFGWILLNLYLVSFAAAGVALWISATTNQQGKAIARSLAFLAISFFVNVLASLWQRIEGLDYLSIYHYYQPQPILEGETPWQSVVVLALVGAVGFAMALWQFSRRDISTV